MENKINRIKDVSDELFIKAVKLAIQNESAAIGYLQRKLAIGYAKACLIVDEMERLGYIIKGKEAKPSKVVVTKEQLYKDFNMIQVSSDIDSIAGNDYYQPQLSSLKSPEELKYGDLCLKELLEDREFYNSKTILSIPLGKDDDGNVIVEDLKRMSNCLVAGRTGSGKSIFLHSLIISLLYNNSPEDLKLVLIDPKRVEFQAYNGLPHLITPEVISGVENAIASLAWCKKEFIARKETLNKLGCDCLEDYNKQFISTRKYKFQKLPYIVVVIDELAEMMAMQTERMDMLFPDLIKYGKQYGIHFVCATQRASIDVLTGTIKENLQTKVCFHVQSAIDSKTIIGQIGAEQIEKNGLALITNPNSPPMNLHTAYVSDDEIKAIVEYIKRKNKFSFDKNIEHFIKNHKHILDYEKNNNLENFSITKETYKQIEEFINEKGYLKISVLQQLLRIGYSLAARNFDIFINNEYVKQNDSDGRYWNIVNKEKILAYFKEKIINEKQLK